MKLNKKISTMLATTLCALSLAACSSAANQDVAKKQDKEHIKYTTGEVEYFACKNKKESFELRSADFKRVADGVEGRLIGFNGIIVITKPKVSASGYWFVDQDSEGKFIDFQGKANKATLVKSGTKFECVRFEKDEATL